MQWSLLIVVFFPYFYKGFIIKMWVTRKYFLLNLTEYFAQETYLWRISNIFEQGKSSKRLKIIPETLIFLLTSINKNIAYIGFLFLLWHVLPILKTTFKMEFLKLRSIA